VVRFDLRMDFIAARLSSHVRFMPSIWSLSWPVTERSRSESIPEPPEPPSCFVRRSTSDLSSRIIFADSSSFTTAEVLIFLHAAAYRSVETVSP
jgi:hypothetical protein